MNETNRVNEKNAVEQMHFQATPAETFRLLSDEFGRVDSEPEPDLARLKLLWQTAALAERQLTEFRKLLDRELSRRFGVRMEVTRTEIGKRPV